MSSSTTTDSKGRKAATGVEKDSFLWAVLFSIEGEYTVNWDDVANRTGMSKGGARNKFNALKKEANGSTGDAPTTPAAATPKKRKAAGTPKTPTTKKAKGKADPVKHDAAEEAVKEEDSKDGVTGDLDDEA